MGWYSMIAVDGKPYRLMGGAVRLQIETADQVAVTMTPTRTSFLFQAGPVTVNATYLSPVEVCLYQWIIILYKPFLGFFSSRTILYNNLYLLHIIICR